MRPQRSPLVPLPDLLAGLIKGQGLEMRMLEFTLQQRWHLIVGSHIAGHTYPEGIRHRKLYLLAENSVWLQQLVFLKAELLNKIGDAMGQESVNDIVLRVGFVPAGAQPVPLIEQPVPLPDSGQGNDCSVSIDAALEAVPAGILAEQLRSLFRKSAAVAGCITVGPTFPERELAAVPLSRSST